MPSYIIQCLNRTQILWEGSSFSDGL